MEDKTISEVPETKTTLLRDVADSQHARWAVFHSRCEPMMRAFMRERFPSLDVDDISQETFVALAKVLPHYVYNPKENGHFHNYLTGVLRNKALKALVARNRDTLLKERAVAEDGRVGVPSPTTEQNEADYKAWRESVYEMVLQQLLADEVIHERTKQGFVRLMIDGEKPEAVAESLGVPYNTVIKMIEDSIYKKHGIGPNRVPTDAEVELVAYCFVVSLQEAREILRHRNMYRFDGGKNDGRAES